MKAKVSIYSNNRKKFLAGRTINPGDIEPELLPGLLANGSIELEPVDIQAAMTQAQNNPTILTGNPASSPASPVEISQVPTQTQKPAIASSPTQNSVETSQEPPLVQEINLSTPEGIIKFFNSSDDETLQRIKGIGQSLAKAIITQRDIAPFTSVEQLQEMLTSLNFNNLELTE